MDWLEAFGFFQNLRGNYIIRCQVETLEDLFPVTMIVVAVQVIAVCPPRFMSWTVCATFS